MEEMINILEQCKTEVEQAYENSRYKENGHLYLSNLIFMSTDWLL